jgi:hypothetical protein
VASWRETALGAAETALAGAAETALAGAAETALAGAAETALAGAAETALAGAAETALAGGLSRATQHCGAVYFGPKKKTAKLALWLVTNGMRTQTALGAGANGMRFALPPDWRVGASRSSRAPNGKTSRRPRAPAGAQATGGGGIA